MEKPCSIPLTGDTQHRNNPPQARLSSRGDIYYGDRARQPGRSLSADTAGLLLAWVNESLHVDAAIFHGTDDVVEPVDQVRALTATYVIRELVYAPWRFGHAAAELAREGWP
ncbi:MAG: hypothetical protein ACJ78X_09490, partial [Myxococcales bacterium]